jgi:lipid-A-disaccharide synthase
LGAGLIQAVARFDPHTRFVGLAGSAMRAAGCWPIDDLTVHSAMLFGLLGNAARAGRALQRVNRYLERFAFDAAVLIDSPVLHLPLAQRLRARGIPVLYHVAPQLWAWGAHRIHRVRQNVDRMAVLLPFEEPYFRDRGVDATFVGHPLFDRLRAEPVDPADIAALRARGNPVVALLPGSRRHVVQEVLPGQLEVARAIAARFPGAHFAVSVANPQVAPLIETRARSGLSTSLHAGRNGALLSAADLALVASGTATLEVAFYGTPMIVMYNSSPWAYRLFGRWLIGTRHLSLVNILAERAVVPEFMPYYRATEPIAAAALDLLESPARRQELSARLRALITPLARPGASERVAEILLSM